MTQADPGHERPAVRGSGLILGRPLAWRLWLAVGIASVAGGTFLLVPDGGSAALLILLGGLMALHHIPGGGHHHGQMGRADRLTKREHASHAEQGARSSQDTRQKKGGGRRSGHCH